MYILIYRYTYICTYLFISILTYIYIYIHILYSIGISKFVGAASRFTRTLPETDRESQLGADLGFRVLGFRV